LTSLNKTLLFYYYYFYYYNSTTAAAAAAAVTTTTTTNTDQTINAMTLLPPPQLTLWPLNMLLFFNPFTIFSGYCWCYYSPFFISVHSGLKCCPFLLDITGVRVLRCNFRNPSLLIATCKNSQSAICVSAANQVCKDVSIFRKPITFLKQILC
jgi:hypothetical protein